MYTEHISEKANTNSTTANHFINLGIRFNLIKTRSMILMPFSTHTRIHHTFQWVLSYLCSIQKPTNRTKMSLLRVYWPFLRFEKWKIKSTIKCLMVFKMKLSVLFAWRQFYAIDWTKMQYIIAPSRWKKPTPIL